MPITINGKYFKTQRDAIDYTRSTLIAHELTGCLTSDNKDWEYFTDLIKRHPDATEKIGTGLKSLHVRRSVYGHIELHIERFDGTSIDISWQTCVKSKGQTTIQNLKAAMRYAVKGQILKFRETHVDGVSVCTICSGVIKDDVHIHHAPPQSFDALVNAFILEISNHPTTFDDDTQTYQARFHKKDRLYEIEWQEYHAKYAILELTHARCNLSYNHKEIQMTQPQKKDDEFYANEGHFPDFEYQPALNTSYEARVQRMVGAKVDGITQKVADQMIRLYQREKRLGGLGIICY